MGKKNWAKELAREWSALNAINIRSACITNSQKNGIGVAPCVRAVRYVWFMHNTRESGLILLCIIYIYFPLLLLQFTGHTFGCGKWADIKKFLFSPHTHQFRFQFQFRFQSDFILFHFIALHILHSLAWNVKWFQFHSVLFFIYSNYFWWSSTNNKKKLMPFSSPKWKRSHGSKKYSNWISIGMLIVDANVSKEKRPFWILAFAFSCFEKKSDMDIRICNMHIHLRTY